MLRGTVTEESQFDFPALQANGFHSLRIPRHQIDGLVTPPHFSAFNVKYNSLDRFLSRQGDSLSIGSDIHCESQIFHCWEVDILKRFWPTWMDNQIVRKQTYSQRHTN